MLTVLFVALLKLDAVFVNCVVQISMSSDAVYPSNTVAHLGAADTTLPLSETVESLRGHDNSCRSL